MLKGRVARGGMFASAGDSSVPGASRSAISIDANHQSSYHDMHCCCPAGQHTQPGADIPELWAAAMARSEAWPACYSIRHQDWRGHHTAFESCQHIACQGNLSSSNICHLQLVVVM